ncbi:MAG: hypothetical protein WKG52_05955 [Variovorax sp.]
MNRKVTHREGAAEQTAWATGALCAALLLPTALASTIDTRTLNDISVWAKPLKFQFSFALHWLTMAWLLQCLAAPARLAAGTRAMLATGGLATVAELLYITVQAARGRASHFNFETVWERALYYGFMGPAAVLIVAVTAWLGWQVWQHRDPHCGAGLSLGAALGLMLGGALTLLVSTPLAAGVIDGPGHWVGGQRTDALGLPLFGWSTTGGDLRVPHFFATHLLQALPLLGWLADRVDRLRAARWVWSGAALGLAVVAATTVQAVSGRALLN